MISCPSNQKTGHRRTSPFSFVRGSLLFAFASPKKRMWEIAANLFAVAVTMVGLTRLGALAPLKDPDCVQNALVRARRVAALDCWLGLHPQRSRWLLTVVCGLVYLTHLFYPGVYLAFLLLRDADAALQFVRLFLYANLVYFLIQLLYPVAPPWKGLPVTNSANQLYRERSRAAGLVRLDEVLHYPLAQSLYKNSHWEDGAMPSGHVLWTNLVLGHWLLTTWYIGPLVSARFVNPATALLAAHSVLMLIGAIHFAHHYVIDCVVALALAAAALACIFVPLLS